MTKRKEGITTRLERIQTTKMRWILFYIFAGIFIFIVIGTLLVVFFGIGETTEKERDVLFNIFMVEVGVAVLALFKLLFSLKKKSKKTDDSVDKVDGKYEYELTCSDNKTRYMGVCCIKQKGRILSFHGERKKSCIEDEEEDVSIRWFSNWAELCQDNKVRMDYSVSVAGGMRGYAVIEMGNKVSEEMAGEFHLIDVSHIYGTVKFNKLSG